MSFKVDILSGSGAKLLLKRFLPEYIRDPLFQPARKSHPVADLTPNINNKSDAQCMIAICIEQIKFTGWNQVKAALLESISTIKTLDPHTKAALLFLGKTVLTGKEGKNG